jgi:hypothetical protein
MKFGLIIFIFWSSLSFGQTRLTWSELGDVTFTEKYVKDQQANYLFPEFGEKISKMEGKEVTIVGYLIPVDPNGDFYVLSKFPNSSCFFCGGAGPETIVELNFNKLPRKYALDERLSFKGTLRLNSKDLNHFNYILSNAKEL